MSRPVQVHYDSLAQRWEIGYADAVGSTLPIESGDEWSVGRDGGGLVVEIVVDAIVPPAQAMTLIRETFGSAVADVVRDAVAGRDLDATVTINLPARAVDATAAIAGEPGVPQQRTPERYTVPLERGDVELVVSRGELRLRLPGDFGTREWWVRVGHVDTGELLALGPVRVDDTATPQATLGFGLDLPPEHLHVTVTERPLAPVGTREERRRAWVLQLLESAQVARRFRPRRARRLAAQARSVAMVLHDTELRRRAELFLRRQRRQSWGVSAVAVLAVAGVIIQTSGSTPGPSLLPTPFQAVGSVGPAEFRLLDQSRIEASLVGVLARFSPGDVVPVTVEVTSRHPWSYGPNPDIPAGDTDAVLAKARRTCLGITDVPPGEGVVSLPPFTLKVRLDRMDPADDTRRLDRLNVGSFAASSSLVSSTSDKESCRSPQFGAANGFEAVAAVRRASQIIAIALPDNLPPGVWELSVEGPTPLVAQEGVLRLVIEP